MREPLDTTVSIETPEHVTLRLRLAGPWRRGLAYAIDGLIRGFIVLMLLVLISMAEGSSAFNEQSTGMALIVIFVVEWGYYVLLESMWSGQTPGKRVLALRTVKEGGFPMGFVDSVLRNLLRAADWLPVGGCVGIVCSSIDPRFRRLGDMVAGTVVIHENRARLLRGQADEVPPTADELATLPHRVPLQADERRALERFVPRRNTLAPAREEELAELLAPRIAERLGVRYRDPGRFLALVHHRATQPVGASAAATDVQS
ncbi:MAG: RDD family protein [Myxococcota bacterium]